MPGLVASSAPDSQVNSTQQKPYPLKSWQTTGRKRYDEIKDTRLSTNVNDLPENFVNLVKLAESHRRAEKQFGGPVTASQIHNTGHGLEPEQEDQVRIAATNEINGTKLWLRNHFHYRDPEKDLLDESKDIHVRHFADEDDPDDVGTYVFHSQFTEHGRVKIPNDITDKPSTTQSDTGKETTQSGTEKELLISWVARSIGLSK